MRFSTAICQKRHCDKLVRSGFRFCPSCISGIVIEEITGEEE